MNSGRIGTAGLAQGIPLTADSLREPGLRPAVHDRKGPGAASLCAPSQASCVARLQAGLSGARHCI